MIDAAIVEFDKGVDAALGELKRIATLGVIDVWELRRVTHDQLQLFAENIKAFTKPDELRALVTSKEVDEKLSEIDHRLKFALRQFDVGFDETTVPEEPFILGNNIQIETMIGGAIQQGTRDSSQITASLDIPSALRTIERIEMELSRQDLTPFILELRGDLATIKAQLSKPSPSQAILTEASKSFRNVVEGVIAGATTNKVVQMSTELLRSLGLT